jgi:predicted nucleic acid-binding protein
MIININIYLKNINEEIIIDALNSSIKDFEDAVQVFAAEYNEIEAIITRNKKDFQSCDLKFLSPKELVHKIVK